VIARLSCLLGLALSLNTLSAAQGFSYAGKTAKIRAGVVVLSTQVAAINYLPFVWGNYDEDRLGKPAEWSIDNPRGQSTITESMRNRYLSVGAPDVPAPGTRLTKRMAGYWEVPLSLAPNESLADYDVLLLPMGSGFSLSPIERVRLMRFVDQGGILWICTVGVPASPSIGSSPPMPMSYMNSFEPLGADFGHSLLNYPNTVTLDDLKLASTPGMNEVGNSFDDSIVNTIPVFSRTNMVHDAQRLQYVAGTSDGATLAVGQIGAGYVVYTTRGVGATIARTNYGGGPAWSFNRFVSNGVVEDPATASASKLVTNIISLASESTTPGQSSRRSGSSRVDLTAPLLKNYGVADPTGASLNLVESTSPAVFKGHVIFTTGNSVVAMDARSDRDLDGDGNPDDGVPTPPGFIGYQGDVLWSVNINGESELSPPTCGEVPNSPIGDMILVTGASGRVYAMSLDPVNPAAPTVQTINPPQAGVGYLKDGHPLAPTIHESMAFVADSRSTDNYGRLWVINLENMAIMTTSGAGNWTIQGSARLGPPGASPTVGYIPIYDNSGGADRVVYFVNANNTSGEPGNDRPVGFCSIWLGARGENPQSVSDNTTSLTIVTRASLSGLPVFNPTGTDSRGIRLNLVQASTGRSLTDAEMNVVFNGPPVGDITGVITVSLRPGYLTTANFTDPTDPNYVVVRVDYTIDWGRASTGISGLPADAFIRGNIELPDTPTQERRLQGNLALAPNGNLFIVSSKQPSGGTLGGGTLFALREEGRGDFKTLYRYDLFDNINIRLNQQTIPYEATLHDYDELNQMLTFLDGPSYGLYFYGGPTVKGNTVYVNARGFKKSSVFPFPIPTAVLMAFNADPATPEVVIQNLQPGFTLVQPDYARSTDVSAGIPPAFTTISTFSQLRPGEYSVETDPANPSLSRIRLNNAANVTRGRIRDCVSMSLPIILRRNGSTDIIVEPENTLDNGTYVPGNARGRWSPLKWYTFINGATSYGSPLVTGETVYVATNSVLPSLIGSGTPFPAHGLLFGMDANISSNDPFLKANPNRPWQSQLSFMLQQPGNPPFRITPSIRWPQTIGAQSFFDFRIRLLQNALNDTAAYGVVGGEGTLISWGSQRLYSFSRADFLIADEGRAGRYDSSGNPIWTTSNTLQAGKSGPVGLAANLKSLSRPNRIYANGSDGYWIVDTGNDRIIRTDRSGRELRTLDRLKLAPSWEPEGFLNNETLKLRGPKDLVVFTSVEPAASNVFARRYGAADNRANVYPFEYWVHYLIADTGNFRMVELVDRYIYDSVTGRTLGPIKVFDPASTNPTTTVTNGINTFTVNETAVAQLLWHSPSELSGKQYAYNSIARMFVANPTPHAIYAFGFGNFEPGRASFGLDTPGPGQVPDVDVASGLGGVVLFDGSQTQVISDYRLPNLPANIFWNDATNSFSSPARPSTARKFTGVNGVSLRYVTTAAGPTIGVMVSDNSGIVELIQSVPGAQYDVRWWLPNEAYTAIRRDNLDVPVGANSKGFRAMFAKRLDSGEVLVVNGYDGTDRAGNPLTGEVVLLDGNFDTGVAAQFEPGFSFTRENLGFATLSMNFRIPPVVGARGIVAPTFAERH